MQSSDPSIFLKRQIERVFEGGNAEDMQECLMRYLELERLTRQDSSKVEEIREKIVKLPRIRSVS